MPSSIRRWSPNLLPRLPSSEGITDSTTAQNSSEITPMRVTGQSSPVRTRKIRRHALDLATGERHPGVPPEIADALADLAKAGYNGYGRAREPYFAAHY